MTILPVRHLGEIAPGADLAGLLAEGWIADEAPPIDGDVLVVTQKIVSKAEGRFVDLRGVAPSSEALRLATIALKDPRFVEIVLREAEAVVRAAPNVLITRHRLGMVMANSGIDQSNLGPGGDERVLLLPADPDASAARLRNELAERLGVDIAVIVSDSFGRPWRLGVVNVAIGAAGLASLVDERGKGDRGGRALGVTQIALADAIAGAAGLVMGEAAEGIPAAIVRGVDLHSSREAPATALLRSPDEDLFR
ncbi:MAG: coenzyme F420-0:L-glutamate ligase / coenzyme F420:gamma-L-glutamate ligase [Sphingomonadales bacterium]|nr:coenzyme F420-0:L-glutamate ligase / coenzyme F420:gamma-L-glutamate ligase [Sphingomonadales bacterium]